MKKNFKVVICALLTILMIISIVACNNQSPVDTENTTDGVTEAPTEDTTAEITTEVPATEKTTEEDPTDDQTEDKTTEQTTEEVTTEPKEDEVIEENPLRFDEDGNFQIMILSDLRLKADVDQTVIADMIKLLDEVKPDVVLFGGDIHDGSVKTEAELRAILDALNAPLEERNIRWCNTFGVDSEGKGGASTGFTRQEQLAVYQTYEYCITPNGAEGVYGVSNYVIPIRYANNNKIGFNLWCLDTNGYLNDYEKGMEDNVLIGEPLSGGTNFDTLHFSQILWYWNRSVEMQKANSGKAVPGIMYFQIPALQLYYIRQNSTVLGMTGIMYNVPSASERESGIVWTCFERGDIYGIFCGYDAKNDYAGTYLDMTLAGCSSIGADREEFNAGARVISLGRNGSRYETYMAYVNEQEDEGERDPLDPDVIELVINEDGTHSNGANHGWPLIVSNDPSGEGKFVYVNPDVNRPVVLFDGISTYSVDSLDINNTLADGFSYEVYFRVTSAVSSGYKGVFDYEENGGFGLDIYPSSEPNSVDISAEIALGSSGWKKLSHTVELYKWVHCVYTYDGKTYALYINGELVGSAKSSDDMRLPRFDGGGTPYICIGACAQTKTIGSGGFSGEIAICNMFSEGLTAEQAAALYEKNVKNYQP